VREVESGLIGLKRIYLDFRALPGANPGKSFFNPFNPDSPPSPHLQYPDIPTPLIPFF
jgi:hypothetical protein